MPFPSVLFDDGDTQLHRIVNKFGHSIAYLAHLQLTSY